MAFDLQPELPIGAFILQRSEQESSIRISVHGGKVFSGFFPTAQEVIVVIP